MADKAKPIAQLHVLDLPKLYQRPLARDLLESLDLLRIAPPSFEGSGPINERSAASVNPEGVPKYLTMIVASPLDWIEDESQREAIWDSASQCLSERSGRSAQGPMTRTFYVPTNFGVSVPIVIHEPAYTSDNIGSKTWSSSYVLARQFHLMKLSGLDNETEDEESRAILELGSGTGLLGIAAALVFKSTVYLTDLASIQPNLTRNVEMNKPVLLEQNGGTMLSGVLDWSKPDTIFLMRADGTMNDLTGLKFSVILVADPVYSDEHPRQLANTVKQYLSCEKDSRLVIALPLRDGYAAERGKLEEALSASCLTVADKHYETGQDDWGTEEEPYEVQYEITTWMWNAAGLGLP